MNLLKFFRDIEQRVIGFSASTADEHRPSVRVLTPGEIRSVLVSLFTEEPSNCLPLNLMTPVGIAMLMEHSTSFYSMTVLQTYWPETKLTGKFSVNLAEFTFLRLHLRNGIRPVEQQHALEAFVEQECFHELSMNIELNTSLVEVAEYAWKSISGKNKESIGCYLTSAAVLLGIPTDTGLLHDGDVVSSFCKAEVRSIRGLTVTEHNEELLAGIFHVIVYKLFGSATRLGKLSYQALTPVEANRAAWLAVAIGEEPMVILPPLLDFILRYMWQDGLNLENVRRLDAIEEELIWSLILIHAHIKEELHPLVAKAYHRK